MGRFIKTKFFLFLSIILSLELYAMEGITVLEVSSSGSSIVVDRGSLEGVREAQTGQFYYQGGTPEKPVIYFIGDAEVIKAHSDRSFWYFKKVENLQFIKKGRRVLFTRDRVVLNGRRKYKIRKKEVILPRAKSLNEYIEDRKRGVPSEIVFKEKNYKSSGKIIQSKPPRDYDVGQTKFKDWKKRGNPEFSPEYLDEIETYFIDQSDKGVKTSAIRRALDREVYKSSMEGAINKVNDSKAGLDGLYVDSQPDRASYSSMYDEARQRSLRPNPVSLNVLNKIEKEGGSWSAQMDDQQLRRYFIKTGLASEKERQDRVLSERIGHEMNLRIFSDIDEQVTVEDPNNQGNGFSFNFSYEVPLKKDISYLRKFTFEVGFEQGHTFYAVNDEVNTRLSYGNFRGFLNWYFWNDPISIKKVVWYMGLGISRGNGKLRSPELFQEYQVSTMALPIYKFGVKYRFSGGDMPEELIKVGFGVGLSVNYEPTRYSVLDSVDSGDDIPVSLRLNRLRVAFGLSAYF